MSKFRAHGFDLHPLLEAILYRPLSFGGRILVRCPEFSSNMSKFRAHGFDLHPLLEAILYRPLSFGGRILVRCPEFRGCLHLGD